MGSRNLVWVSFLFSPLTCFVLAGPGSGYANAGRYNSETTDAVYSSPGCMTCLCQAATGCDVNKQCVGDVCGAFAISWQYWKDAGQPGGDYVSCANDLICALHCVQSYVNKFAQDCDGNGRIDCADAARLHRLGRTGCAGWLDSEFASRLSSCDASTAPGITEIFAQAKRTPSSAYASATSRYQVASPASGPGCATCTTSNYVGSSGSSYVGSSGSSYVGSSGLSYVGTSGSGYVGSTGSNDAGGSGSGDKVTGYVGTTGSGYVGSTGMNYVGSSSGTGYTTGTSRFNPTYVGSSGSGYVGSAGMNYVGSSSGTGYTTGSSRFNPTYVGSSGSGYVGSAGTKSVGGFRGIGYTTGSSRSNPTYVGSSGGSVGSGPYSTGYVANTGYSGGESSIGDKYGQNVNPSYGISTGNAVSASASSPAHSTSGYFGASSGSSGTSFFGGGSEFSVGGRYGSGQYSGAAVSDHCLSCICNAATACSLSVGCNHAGCGPLRISRAYWVDAGSPGGDYEGCTNNLECSMGCARNYLTKYAKDCNGDGVVLCGDYARIHRLGPHACHGELDWEFLSQINNCPA